MPPRAEQGAETLRTRLAEGIDADFAEIANATLLEAMQATKQARVQRSCAKCGCTHIEYAPVMDTVAATNAIKLALEQTEGRPGVAGDQADTGLVIRRYSTAATGLEQLPAWQALAEAGDHEALAAAVLAATSVVDLTPPT